MEVVDDHDVCVTGWQPIKVEADGRNTLNPGGRFVALWPQAERLPISSFPSAPVFRRWFQPQHPSTVFILTPTAGHISSR